MRAGEYRSDRGVLQWALVTALGVAVVAVLATVAAASSSSARSDRVEMDFGAEVLPLKLSKLARTPVALTLYGEIGGPTSTEYAPPVRTLAIDLGRAFALDIDALPTCRPAQIQEQDSREVEERCRGAIIGRGRATIGFYFPGDRLVPSSGELLAINGGRRGGLTRLYLHWHTTEVVERTLVMPMEIRRISGTRFGMEAIWNLSVDELRPALLEFRLTISRRLADQGRAGPLTLRCSRARIPIRARAAFEFGRDLVLHTHAACAPMP